MVFKKCSIFSNAARNSDANLLQRMSEVQMPTEHENLILFLSGVLKIFLETKPVATSTLGTS